MIALDVFKRFGRWDDLLNEPAPKDNLLITTAFWHFSRGVAHAAKGQIEEAQKEQGLFRAAVGNVPQDAIMVISPAHDVLAVAEQVLAGEIAFREGKVAEAVEHLRKAVEREDGLTYMEPPEWIQPARHTLGAVLVSAKRYSEAEQVYREDLEVWPENGWSLHGLARCLREQGNEKEAKEVDERFRKTWRRADVKIGSSCLCVP
jgi:tetratricopeptide (TPR) repeat protein